MVDASKALASGISAGIGAARTGNNTGDVARALNAELVKSGIHREGRCGYPIWSVLSARLGGTHLFHKTNRHNRTQTWYDVSFYAGALDG